MWIQIVGEFANTYSRFAYKIYTNSNKYYLKRFKIYLKQNPNQTPDGLWKKYAYISQAISVLKIKMTKIKS